MANKQEMRSQLAKQKLIDAAAQLFKDRKVNEVGIREIAAQAGVTTGTFYHHFSGKDELVHILYQERDQEFGKFLNNACQESGPYLPKVLDFFSNNLAKRVEDDGIDFTMHRMFTLRKVSGRENDLYKGMTRLLECARDNGEIGRKYDLVELNNFLFMIFRGVVYDWCITPDDRRPELPELERMAMGNCLRAFTEDEENQKK